MGGKTANKRLYSVVGRYKQGRHVVGYMVQTPEMARVLASREQVIDLAARGLMANCRTYRVNGRQSLTGVGCDLTKLPEVCVDSRNLGYTVQGTVYPAQYRA